MLANLKEKKHKVASTKECTRQKIDLSDLYPGNSVKVI